MPDNHSESSGEFINNGTQNLTAELVRQVADKVYKLFLKDLKQENERRRNQNPSYRR